MRDKRTPKDVCGGYLRASLRGRRLKGKGNGVLPSCLKVGWLKVYLIRKFFLSYDSYQFLFHLKALGKLVEEDSITHERADCKDTNNKVTLLIVTFIIFGGS